MVHFAVQCIPYTSLGAGRVSLTKERIKLINLPLFFLHGHDHLQKIDLGRVLIKNGQGKYEN